MPGYQRFDLTLTQPIDHDHPEAGTFMQRATLLHASDTAPMVLFTSGYGLATNPRPTELAQLFSANQLSYEHRYFVSSRPVPTDWSKLDIREAALDAHHLAEALHWLYPGRWVNTGGSKGGMTSVYQRRFHPCDVDATVAYVAPTSASTVDPAYNAFLEQVGGPSRAACRADLVAFQRRLLEQRAAIEPLVQGTFTLIDLDKAFEIAVIELSFVFWQYTHPDDPQIGCGAVPGPTATPEEMRAFLESHVPIDGLGGAASLDYYHAFYYQSAAQLGYPAPYEVPLADLVHSPGADTPSTYLPADEHPVFDPQAMADIDAWVANEGERLMFIYGELDPWSAEMFQTSTRDSHRFVVSGGNHGSNIAQLSASDRAAAIALLTHWLSAPPAAAALRASRPASVRQVDREDLEGLRPPL